MRRPTHPLTHRPTRIAQLRFANRLSVLTEDEQNICFVNESPRERAVESWSNNAHGTRAWHARMARARAHARTHARTHARKHARTHARTRVTHPLTCGPCMASFTHVLVCGRLRTDHCHYLPPGLYCHQLAAQSDWAEGRQAKAPEPPPGVVLHATQSSWQTLCVVRCLR